MKAVWSIALIVGGVLAACASFLFIMTGVIKIANMSWIVVQALVVYGATAFAFSRLASFSWSQLRRPTLVS